MDKYQKRALAAAFLLSIVAIVIWVSMQDYTATTALQDYMDKCWPDCAGDPEYKRLTNEMLKEAGLTPQP